MILRVCFPNTFSGIPNSVGFVDLLKATLKNTVVRGFDTFFFSLSALSHRLSGNGARHIANAFDEEEIVHFFRFLRLGMFLSNYRHSFLKLSPLLPNCEQHILYEASDQCFLFLHPSQLALIFKFLCKNFISRIWFLYAGHQTSLKSSHLHSPVGHQQMSVVLQLHSTTSN